MDFWNDGQPISNRFDDIDVPAWIDDNISPYDVAAIVQGGCNSGAYMPAVTYSSALATMSKHGDDVLQYIQDALGELPLPDDNISWAGMAVHYLSFAVELWASNAADILENIEEAA
jgi:hypothetical protein